VDSEVGAVYQFDLQRRRFLGPAPLVAGVGRMPGFPTVLGDFAAQGAWMGAKILFVADGDDGSVSSVEVTSHGLGRVDLVRFPVFDVTFSGGVVVPTATRFIDTLVPLGDGEMLAVGKDRVNGIGIAYAFDPLSARVTGAVQLPFGYPQAVAYSGTYTAVAMDGKQLLVIGGEPLAIRKTIALSGVPRGLAIVDHWAYVAVDNPARLLKVDLETEQVASVDAVAPGKTSLSQEAGPVATDGRFVWWSLKTGEIREVAVHGGHTRSFQTCKYVNSLAHAGTVLLATCLDHAQLVLVDLASATVYATRAGFFPSAVVTTSVGL
jgi:hypothetical protein